MSGKCSSVGPLDLINSIVIFCMFEGLKYIWLQKITPSSNLHLSNRTQMTNFQIRLHLVNCWFLISMIIFLKLLILKKLQGLCYTEEFKEKRLLCREQAPLWSSGFASRSQRMDWCCSPVNKFIVFHNTKVKI